MTLNKKNAWGGVSFYETPLVTTLEFSSEGVLCASGFDTDNHTELFDRLQMEDL